jgi:Secretion system C-terminal sorting domain
MKKLLFMLLAGLSALASQAQTYPGIPRPGVPFIPGQLSVTTSRQTATRPASTIRVPGRTTNYRWDPATNRWSSAPEVVRSTYNAAGQVTLEVATDSATGRLISRRTFGYTAANNYSSFLEEVWDGSAWQNQAREQFTYNILDTYTGSLSQEWVAGAWQNKYRDTRAHDSHNSIISYLSQNWVNNSWVTWNGGRLQHSYDAAGRISETIDSTLNATTGTFYPPTKSSYLYLTPTSELVAETIGQILQNGIYVASSRQLYTYTPQQRLNSFEYQSWEGAAWVSYSRGIVTYSVNTRGYEELIQGYDAGTWVNSIRYVITYDVYGNITGSSYEDWRNGTWLPQNASRYMLRYDAANNVTRQILQLYNNTTGAFDYTSLTTYGDYQTIVLGTKPNAALAARTALYPNPTTGAVTLAVADLPGTALLKVELLNSLGQVVQTHSLQPRQGQLRQELHMEQLPAGPYLLRVQTPAGTVVKRIVRQ